MDPYPRDRANCLSVILHDDPKCLLQTEFNCPKLFSFLPTQIQSTRSRGGPRANTPSKYTLVYVVVGPYDEPNDRHHHHQHLLLVLAPPHPHPPPPPKKKG